jgi:hypothetical protein
MRAADARFDKELRDGPFLWVDASPDRKKQVLAGKILAERVSGPDATVPDGLIHDWIGAAFIPGTTVAQTIRMVEDYDHHKDIYKPEVMRSKLISRDGDDFKVYLRLLKKQILTVVLDTDHDVHYARLDDTHWYSRSRSTRIAEVVNPGSPNEHLLPPGNDHGFLWRLNSYWRFAERDGGVYIECEAISLTRDVPTGLGWLINPIIKSLPKDSLTNTLRETRQALAAPSRAR